MKSGYKLAAALLWFTQLGLSVVSPLFIFIFGSVWLRDKTGAGDWLVAVGVALGVIGAIGGLISSLKSMARLSGSGKKQENKDSFNEHE